MLACSFLVCRVTVNFFVARGGLVPSSGQVRLPDLDRAEDPRPSPSLSEVNIILFEPLQTRKTYHHPPGFEV